ncbi:Uncharacterized protein TPAR_02770, partial [Tolypocladium paradoxum]
MDPCNASIDGAQVSRRHPEPPETAIKRSTSVCRSPLLSPSLSQETLRPTEQFSNFYFGKEDDGRMDDDTGGSGPACLTNLRDYVAPLPACLCLRKAIPQLVTAYSDVIRN